jgi:hypothetical protein
MQSVPIRSDVLMLLRSRGRIERRNNVNPWQLEVAWFITRTVATYITPRMLSVLSTGLYHPFSQVCLRERDWCD